MKEIMRINRMRRKYFTFKRAFKKNKPIFVTRGEIFDELETKGPYFI